MSLFKFSWGNEMNHIELAEPAEPIEPAKNGSLVEQLLSPLALQRMMACGGGVLVLGFVGWLWSIGLFENPVVVAATIGITTLTVMGSGMALVRFTRYQLAGTGMTLLAALAMPLNLWFYSAQGLITIVDGGHLWIPAAICCAIYAFIARVLRDPLFVYTLVGGVVLTGMLFLADQAVGHFWELLPPATFLVVTGWVCLFAERMFPKEEGDFSRDNFGKAFYRAGIVVLAGGLGLVLNGQIASLIGGAIPFIKVPLLATDQLQKIWATSLIAGSAVGFASEHLLRKSQGYRAAALGLSTWTVISLLDAFSFQPRLPHVAIAAGVALIVNLLRERKTAVQGPSTPTRTGLDSSWGTFGLIVMAVCQFGAQFLVVEGNLVMAPVSWVVVLQLVVTAVACVVTWFRAYEIQTNQAGFDGTQRPASSSFLCWSLVHVVFAVLTATVVLDIASLDLVAALGLAIPVVAVLSGTKIGEPNARRCCQTSAGAALTALLLCLPLFAVTGLVMPIATHTSWFWILTAASVTYFASSWGQEKTMSRVFGYTTSSLAASQGFAMLGVSADYSFVLAPTLVGLTLSIVNAFRRNALQPGPREIPANVLVISGTMLGLFMAASRLFAQEADVAVMCLLVCQLVAIGITGVLTNEQGWRMCFRAAAIGNVLAGVAVLDQYIDTHWLHRVEIASLLIGLALLVISHLAWYREGDKEDETATVGLWFGSFFVAIPIAIGLIFYRSFEVRGDWNWMLFHEIAAIVAALALLGAGLACRIRSTTINGMGLLSVYVLSVLALVQWPSQLQSVSVVMMAGGGMFFVTAVLLSIYRDRLVSFHSDIREARGMFRVLRWR